MTTQSIKNFLLDPKMHITLTWVTLAGILWGIWYRSAIFTNMQRDISEHDQAIQQIQAARWGETAVVYNFQERMARVEEKQDSMQYTLNQVQQDIRYVISELKKK